MPQYLFGSGKFFATPQNSTGAAVTPICFSALQGFELDIKFEEKSLFGPGQFPIQVARGKGSITGKFTNGSVSGATISQLYLGASQATGQLQVSSNEAAVVPAATPLTVSPANNTAVQADLGVTYASTATPFTRVLSNPTQGQYTFALNNGVATYTFAAADEGQGILLNYSYNVTGTGNTAIISSQPMGAGVTFTGVYNTILNGMQATIQLNACMANDFKLNAKNDDFVVPDFSFSAFGNVGIVSLSQ